MEAIWQGVPVLTFAGDRWASRTSHSLLHDTPLGAFVAADVRSYIDRAVELSRDAATPARLADLRSHARVIPAALAGLQRPRVGSQHGMSVSNRVEPRSRLLAPGC